MQLNLQAELLFVSYLKPEYYTDVFAKQFKKRIFGPWDAV